MKIGTQQRRKERIDRGIKVRTDGLYALMSWRELSYLTAPRLLLIGGLLLLPLVLPGMYWERVLTIVCIYALLALSFDLLAHYVGLVSLGGAFFVGVGGYLTALLNTELGISPLVAVPAAAILGGTDGILGIDGFPYAWLEQYGVIGMLLLILFGFRRLVNTDLGLVMRAVKDNDQAVNASGMNITHYKALAVFIASSVGCLAGACLVHTYMWAGISTFALDFSILPIAATVIGGGGTLVGPVLGCLILVPISELLRDFGTLRIVFYSLILLGFIVFRSEGLMIDGQRKYQQFERWTNI